MKRDKLNQKVDTEKESLITAIDANEKKIYEKHMKLMAEIDDKVGRQVLRETIDMELKNTIGEAKIRYKRIAHLDCMVERQQLIVLL